MRRWVEECRIENQGYLFFGDKKWEELIVKVEDPFYSIEAKFFLIDDIKEAWAWIK
ncbi:MAG: STAS/SEC14 domain-containing protein [Spirochaetaceae bacterium]|nr:STAS/SEC14 domain-containing protein [Spirochaetaceae bacterium]